MPRASAVAPTLLPGAGTRVGPASPIHTDRIYVHRPDGALRVAGVHIRNSSNEAEAQRVFKGQWWLPSAPTRRVGGTLEYLAGEGVTLELHGNLVERGSRRDTEIIFGIADGKAITFADAHHSSHSGRQTSDGHHEILREVWRGYHVLVGMHTGVGEAVLFDSFDLQTSLLPRWVNSPRATTSSTEGGNVVVEVQVPDALMADVDGLGTLELWWAQSENYRDSDTSVDISITPMLRLHAPEALTFHQAWLDFVTPSLFFVSLVSGSADRILALHVSTTEDEEHPFGQRAEVLVPTWTSELPKSRSVHFWEQLLPFPTVEKQFGDLLPRWFDLYRTTRDSMLDFFSTEFTPFMYAEESFVRVVRSMESWHRSRIGGTYMSKERFETLLQKVQDGLDGPARAFIKMRLAHGNERTLKQRLDELTSLAGEPVAPLIASYTKFARRVVDTRNSLAHEGALGTAFSDTELFYAQRSLEQVFRSVLLRELGLSTEQVAEAVSRSSSWRTLTSPHNPLVNRSVDIAPA